jgi:hypothetical protein
VPRDTLQRNLDRLHQELANTESLDRETRELLAQVAADIERVLADEGAGSGDIGARVQTAALRFEADHPKLSQALSEVTDALAKLGV